MKIKKAVVALALLPVLAASGCPDDDAPPTDVLDCDDFDSQDQAQRAFEQSQTTSDRDPHQLDSDGNGRACEELS